MWRLMKVLLILVLSLWIMPSVSGAQAIRINPLPPHIFPKWTPVPGAPQVYYAPNVPTDVFRYRGRFYFYWEGFLYESRTPKGPWKSVAQPPAFFYNIDPGLFKTLRAGKGEEPQVPVKPPSAQAPQIAVPEPPPAPPAAPGAPTWTPPAPPEPPAAPTWIPPAPPEPPLVQEPVPEPGSPPAPETAPEPTGPPAQPKGHPAL